MTNEEIIATMTAEELEALYWDAYADELADAFDGELEYPEDF